MLVREELSITFRARRCWSSLLGSFFELLRHEVRCCFSIVYFQLSGYGLYQYKHTSGIVRSKKCFGPFLPMLYFLFLNLSTPAYDMANVFFYI